MRDRSIESLVSGFLRSAAEHPQRPALDVDGAAYTYAQLFDLSSRLASMIERHAGATERLCAVLGYRSLYAYLGVLGTLIGGRGYVPLNPMFPVSRNAAMINASGVRVVIADHTGCGLLSELLPLIDHPLVILGTDDPIHKQIETAGLEHQFVSLGELEAWPTADPSPAGGREIAYLMFTSGSTGVPKGVMVSHENTRHYITAMLERYDLTAEDRFSQMFDLTFDLSVFDMFLCWEVGGRLCVVPHASRFMPAKFVNDKQLTVWFSVPAVIGFMRKLRLLKPDFFPSLRLSLFCGEPLPASGVELWTAAARNSIVDNLYGPTELTIACTAYRWDPAVSPSKSVNGVVPIGRAFPGLEAAVVDEKLQPVETGKMGELCIRGPQTTLGYWENRTLTDERFVSLPGTETSQNRYLWYRTGDLVRYNEDGDLIFFGRVDHQVKILGYRVELGEIEHQIRLVSQSDLVAAIPWPLNESGASSVEAFVTGSKATEGEIIKACQDTMPDYMVPQKVHLVESMPLNVNGKIDRKQLRQILEDRNDE